MAERWTTAEARSAAGWLSDCTTGLPRTGLVMTATALWKDGTTGAPAATVAEVGLGFYRVTFAAAPTKDVLVLLDGGAALGVDRFVPIEVPVGGWPDLLTTLAGRLTAARAAALDFLDALISSRAKPSDVAVTVPAPVVTVPAPVVTVMVPPSGRIS